jgi:thiosulfate dehydrogenase
MRHVSRIGTPSGSMTWSRWRTACGKALFRLRDPYAMLVFLVVRPGSGGGTGGVAMRGFWLGVLATLLAGVVVVLAFLGLGFMPVSADAKPGTFETWLAGFARDAAIERAAPDRESPVAATPENLAAAALLYRDNCAGCHGTPDAKENVFAASLYPPAPQFLSATARENLSDSDGEIFVVLRDGIRFTAMPTFAHMLKDEDLWRLVVFLKHLDDLPPAAVSTLSAR